MSDGPQIQNAIFGEEMSSDNTLHVIGVVSNPARFHSRYRIARDWQKAMLATPGVKLYTVELALGDFRHQITDLDNPNHLQLRSDCVLWHKENLVNLGEKYLLPRNWKYLAWIDTDVHFGNSGWVKEALSELQQYPVIQPWSECLQIGPYGHTMGLGFARSFCSMISRGLDVQAVPTDKLPFGHPGWAWACTRKFWDGVGGLMDWCIFGSADHYMAWSMIGGVERAVPNKMNESFVRLCKQWQEDAFVMTRGNVGYLSGRIEHRFHGPKSARQYVSRSQLFTTHNFDPCTHLKRDEQGVLYVDGKPNLEEDIKMYLRSRNEDSIEER